MVYGPHLLFRLIYWSCLRATRSHGDLLVHRLGSILFVVLDNNFFPICSLDHLLEFGLFLKIVVKVEQLLLLARGKTLKHSRRRKRFVLYLGYF